MRALQTARCIGAALQQTYGERLLTDAAAVIEHGDHSALARAHSLYRDGRLAYQHGQMASGAALLAQAEHEFDAAGSPMHLVAGAYRVNTLVDRAEASQALVLIKTIDSQRDSAYLALHAQLEYEQGMAHGQLGHIYEAIDDTQEALRQYESLHDAENASRARTNLMAVLTLAGLPTEAWRMRRQALAAASVIGAPGVLQAAVINVVYDQIAEKQWDAAAVFADELTHIPHGSPFFNAEALLWRAVGRARSSGTFDAAAFGPAHAAAGAITDPDARAEILDKIRVAEADLTSSSDPARALRLANESVTYRAKQFPYRLPGAYFVRARAHKALGDDAGAEADLQHAIEGIDAQRSTIGDDKLRDSFVGDEDRMFDEAMHLAAARHDYGRFIAISEKSRARLIYERLGPVAANLPPQDIVARMPANTAILHFTTFDNETVLLVIDSRGFETVALPVSRAEARRLRDEYLDAIERGVNAHCQLLSRKLHTTLLAAVSARLHSSQSLVIVPDDTLASVPFASLIDASTGRFVVEDHSVIMAPGITAWLIRHGEPRRFPPQNIVVAGDPAFDSQRFPALPRLLAARNEVKVIAGMYDRSELMMGEAVTRAHLLESMQRAEVIHIAAHAVVNGRDAAVSVIPLTPGPNDTGLLYVSDVTRLHLDRSPVVVLAGCSTAMESAGRGSIRSFATGFLAAGSRAVVGTLWDVADDATDEFSVTFHSDLRKGIVPATALQHTQLALIHSHHRLRDWAAFQLNGYE